MDTVVISDQVCDLSLIQTEDRQLYYKYLYIPVRYNDDVLYIAAVDQKDKLLNRVINNRYGSNVKFLSIEAEALSEFFFKYFKKIDVDYATSYFSDNFFARSAKYIPREKLAVLAVMCIISCILLCDLNTGILCITTIMNVIYFVTMIFRNYLFYDKSVSEIVDNDAEEFAIYDWPTYTILIPLFKEENIVSILLQRLDNLDYPHSKLDIKLLVEEEDILTRNVINSLQLKNHVNVIIVPKALPLTKPKACNYGLLFAKGEYVVIYDADDMPERDQLKKAVRMFRKFHNVSCLQARLGYYNHDYNILTSCFEIEYKMLFNHLLPSIEALNMPIPLGGTSNHFRVYDLREMGAWDPYNVTEDAELGMRSSSMGYKIGMLDSVTLEEAPISTWAWIKQRTRWIKGFLQTYVIYLKFTRSIHKNNSMKGVLLLHLFIGAPVLVFFFSSLLWILVPMYVCGYLLLPKWLFYFCMCNFFMGILFNISVAYKVAVMNDRKFSWKLMIAYQLYWFLHAISAFRAVGEFFSNPFFWDKTRHGMCE